MIKLALTSAILFLIILLAHAEPPAERLEGAKLDPELLTRVKDLLINDNPAAQEPNLSNGPVFPRTQSHSESYGPPNRGYDSMTLMAPSPSPSFGNGGFDKSFAAAAPPMDVSGGLSNSFSTAPGLASAGEVTLSDPIPAPLLSAFDLSPTVEKRT